MHRILGLAMSCLAVGLSPVPAQQTGDLQRNYTINGNGSMQSSYVQTTLGVPVAPFNHLYETQSPNAPVVWAFATSGTIGWVASPTNSIDIGPGGLGWLLDGSGLLAPGPASFLAHTNAAGRFTVNFGTSATMAGLVVYLAMAHFTPSSPDAVYVSQTHRIPFVLDPNLGPASASCSPAGVPLALGDDTFLQQALPAPFPFFGFTFTQCFVGSNGYVTFGSGDTTFPENIPAFIANQARISQYWDDFNPGGMGTVTWSTGPSGSWSVCFNNVPEYNQGPSNVNSFKVTAMPGQGITMDYAPGMSSIDGLVGLTIGGGLTSAFLLNLSSGPNLIPPGTSPCELFDFASQNDLAGRQVVWVLSPQGFPISQH